MVPANTPIQYKRRTKFSKKMTSVSESSAPLCTVQQRKHHKISKKVSKFVPYQSNSTTASSREEKITKKDQSLHKLLFEKNALPHGTKVAYFSHGKEIVKGYMTEDGICCDHCGDVVSPSKFERHAGWASRKKPYSYIYLSNMVSLHDFAMFLLLERGKSSMTNNDGRCNICYDDGDLLICDGCPSSFHQECASLPAVPQGKWYCMFCQNMFQRSCNAEVIAAGKASGVDMEQLTERRIRVVKDRKASKFSECVLCRCADFLQGVFGPRTVMLCDQCDKEYHVECLKKHKIADLQELPKDEWFCCQECNAINCSLKNLLRSGGEKLPNSLLDITQKKQNDKALEDVANMDVRFRLLNSEISSDENRLLLAEAYAILRERFKPIIDESGDDEILSMVYGRTISDDKDFHGMYCAILTVNSTVVSVGLLRVFGRDIAELPVIATAKKNEGKGYLQLLYSQIENLLASLEVRYCVLPALKKVEDMWIHRFGFQKISKEKLKEYKRTFWQLQTYNGSVMLEKAVPRQDQC